MWLETILFELIFPLHANVHLFLETITKCLAITYERQISISKLHFQLGEPLRENSTPFHSSMVDNNISRRKQSFYISILLYAIEIHQLSLYFLLFWRRKVSIFFIIIFLIYLSSLSLPEIGIYVDYGNYSNNYIFVEI